MCSRCRNCDACFVINDDLAVDDHTTVKYLRSTTVDKGGLSAEGADNSWNNLPIPFIHETNVSHISSVWACVMRDERCVECALLVLIVTVEKLVNASQRCRACPCVGSEILLGGFFSYEIAIFYFRIF